MSGGAKGCLVGFVVLLAILAFGWWGFRGETTTLRSRLTLVVETPEGERSGSSVSQLTILAPGRLNRAIGFSSLSTTGEQGEAVVVDLGARGVLFATLADERALRSGGSGMYNAARVPFPQTKFHGEVGEGIWAKDDYTAYLEELNRRKPRAELPFADLPVLVRFRDLSDPSSVVQVSASDLAGSFGPGVRLQRAFVEITDDPPTTGIEARLPWLITRITSSRSLIPPPPGLQLLSEATTAELLILDNFRRRFP
ncbi:hypothetical protein [Bradyrhizobium sp. LTSP885]|uniref:hypothetical protein n=1 Tax=Bradyrhizobium sp. LTSP885 TaxID=1619232 RepID=UPI000AB42A36|nr:hypothetical protein [Bradyrhizobium sp. LTSP885]